MESSSVQSRAAQRLLQVGVALFLFAVLLGSPFLTLPFLASRSLRIALEFFKASFS
jgi:hypothetical protein